MEKEKLERKGGREGGREGKRKRGRVGIKEGRREREEEMAKINHCFPQHITSYIEQTE